MKIVAVLSIVIAVIVVTPARAEEAPNYLPVAVEDSIGDTVVTSLWSGLAPFPMLAKISTRQDDGRLSPTTNTFCGTEPGQECQDDAPGGDPGWCANGRTCVYYYTCNGGVCSWQGSCWCN
jgi:hypothetical protein